MLKQEIDKILNQQMTRRQFLGSLGLGLLTIVGIPAIIHILMPKPNQAQISGSGKGFGYGPYGS